MKVLGRHTHIHTHVCGAKTKQKPRTVSGRPHRACSDGEWQRSVAACFSPLLKVKTGTVLRSVITLINSIDG